MIGVVGAGVTGARIVDQLCAAKEDHVLLHDMQSLVAQRLASFRRGETTRVSVVDAHDLNSVPVVILACKAPHATLARQLLETGVSVVSLSDDVTDVLQLLELNQVAMLVRRTLIVGAASSPGMSGLLLRHLATSFDSIDEVHVALHGTGGPDCARQHHRALGGQSIGWHDGDWIRRPAGSGRELCWFPEPIGAYDCYRAEVPDPLLLKRAAPELRRVTARVSATRRDRFTARLPMLAPPHSEGGMGGLRIEVRGTLNGARHTAIAGVAERVAQVAGVVAATTARTISSGLFTVPGAFVLGEPGLPNEELLSGVLAAGVRLHEFVGA
ncbi:MAG: saccharopine dehydrogenase family protein [Ilumatobacteraceae bacterium]